MTNLNFTLREEDWYESQPIPVSYTHLDVYKRQMSGSALVSRSGVAPAGSKTINAFWTAAQVLFETQKEKEDKNDTGTTE